MKYEIKPLEWQGDENEDDFYITASTRFCTYSIEPCDGNGVKWEYCIDEYYDEDFFYVDTVEEAKDQAEQHWLKQIIECLKPTQ